MLKKPLGKGQMSIDRISNLPWDVLDSILLRMALKEAVRTSVLSSKWRRQWTRLSHFLVDDKIFPGSPTTLDKDIRWREIANILQQVQMNNISGPVEKFKLAAYCSPDHSFLLRWIAFLFGKGIKEFVLQSFVSPKRFEFPLHALSCRQLCRLELFGCAIGIPEGYAFDGFCSLATLKLTSVRIDPETLRCLILKCPVLESLALFELDHSIFLRLHSTKLKYLKIASAFEDICLQDNPVLAHVDIRMKVNVVLCSRNKASSLVRIVGCLQGVKRLALTNDFVEFLGRRGVPEMLPSLLENLTVFELREVRAENLNHIKVCLCLLRSAPNLEELHISIGGRSMVSLKSVFDFVEEQSHNGLYFNRLKVVKITGIWHFTLAEYFLGLILAHSPLLETLTLIHYDGETIPYELFKEFHYASEHVKIVTLISAS